VTNWVTITMNTRGPPRILPHLFRWSHPDRPWLLTSITTLTSEGSLVRTQLRPPEETRSGYMLMLIRPIPGITAGTTCACCRAGSVCRARW
jgi:hypothetical protein